MPILHGVSASPFVRKTRLALAEKGISYELEPVMPFSVGDDFRKISPLGKIPVWQEGDFALPDSSCIIAYLERRHPDPPLYPEDPQSFGRALFYEEYADTRLVETIGPIFLQRVVNKRVFKQEPDEALVARQLDEALPPVLDYLEGEVGSGEGMVDGRFSVADIAVASMMVGLEHSGVALDARRWPQLAAYLERVYARPSFASILAWHGAEVRTFRLKRLVGPLGRVRCDRNYRSVYAGGVSS